jgi:hypothetical protein
MFVNRLEGVVNALHKRRLIADVVVGRHQQYCGPRRRFSEAKKCIQGRRSGTSVSRLDYEIGRGYISEERREERLVLSIQDE